LAGLGKDDFLQLLAVQLRHQDPMSPMEDKDFMGQMAQFTSVEQLTNMAGALERMSYAGQLSQSVGLIGKTVTWIRDDGTIGEGVVSSVSIGDNAELEVHVDDEVIAPNDVKSVA
jgi:flagellar basal-body rod modification protein FlgD